jgi:hypothetical protein
MGSHSGRSTPTSARSTPISASSLSSTANAGVIDVTVLPVATSETSLAVLDPNRMATKKVGRERGAAAYSAVEHIALSPIISEAPDAFNAGESSPQWVAVYNRMVEEYYNSGNVRQSTALHGHFVEFYSAF